MMEARRDDFAISTDPARFDLNVIHRYLTRSYWAEGISRELVARSIANSLCFGIYHGEKQVGFARVITDKTTFGYLADVFVLEEYRGKGLSKWLMEVILAHPELQGFRRWLLATRGAHGLYQKFGFDRLAHPENLMEIVRAGMYAADEKGRTKAADEERRTGGQ
jgi:GNAT superfamily N-acetyltransferase